MGDIGRAAFEAVCEFERMALRVQGFSAGTGESLAVASRRLEPRYTFDHRDVIDAMEFREAMDALAAV